MSAKEPLTTSYLLRDVPNEIHQAAIARADQDGLTLKGVLIGLLETYANHGVDMIPKSFRRAKKKNATPKV